MNNWLIKILDEILDILCVVCIWIVIGYIEIDSGGFGYVVCCI